jgi:ribosomal protein L21E
MIKTGDRVRLKVSAHDASRWNGRDGVVVGVESATVFVEVKGEKPDSKGLGYMFSHWEVEAVNEPD